MTFIVDSMLGLASQDTIYREVSIFLDHFSSQFIFQPLIIVINDNSMKEKINCKKIFGGKFWVLSLRSFLFISIV